MLQVHVCFGSIMAGVLVRPFVFLFFYFFYLVVDLVQAGCTSLNPLDMKKLLHLKKSVSVPFFQWTIYVVPSAFLVHWTALLVYVPV